MKSSQIIIQLVANLIIGCVVLLIVDKYLKYPDISTDIGSWGVFYSVFGVLYAIIIGFILISELDKFDSLSEAIDTEVNEIQNVRVLLKYFGDSQMDVINNIRKSLLSYVNSIYVTEWGKMETKSSLPEFSIELENVIESVSYLKSEDENDSIALTSMINKLSGLTECRTKRIYLSNEEIPPPIMKLLIFMSVILIFGFIIMGVQNFWIHIFMVWSLSTTLQLIINLLTDLNSPFEGIWVVEKDHYHGIIGSIENVITNK